MQRLAKRRQRNDHPQPEGKKEDGDGKGIKSSPSAVWLCVLSCRLHVTAAEEGMMVQASTTFWKCLEVGSARYTLSRREIYKAYSLQAFRGTSEHVIR